MSLSISPVQRALFAFSGGAYALAFLGNGTALRAQPAPSSLRISAGVARAAVAIAPSIRRDPFAATPAPHAVLANAGAPASDIEGAAFAAIPPGLTVPAIETLAGVPSGPPRTLVLRATIAGASPVAYVEDGAAISILRPGDAIDGLRIRAIDLHGVEFDDGTRLELPERSAAPVAPRARRAAASPSPAPAAAVAAPTAEPSALASVPTPGPLPTPKGGAYPAGSRPTSDPAAPTAFPYHTLTLRTEERSMQRSAIALLLALATVAPAGATGTSLISLDIRDLDVYDAVRLLSTQASTNVVVDSSVQHRPITLRLRDVAFDEALATLARMQDLASARIGKSIYSRRPKP